MDKDKTFEAKRELDLTITVNELINFEDIHFVEKHLSSLESKKDDGFNDWGVDGDSA